MIFIFWIFRFHPFPSPTYQPVARANSNQTCEVSAVNWPRRTCCVAKLPNGHNEGSSCSPSGWWKGKFIFYTYLLERIWDIWVSNGGSFLSCDISCFFSSPCVILFTKQDVSFTIFYILIFAKNINGWCFFKNLFEQTMWIWRLWRKQNLIQTVLIEIEIWRSSSKSLPVMVRDFVHFPQAPNRQHSVRTS